MGGTSKVATCLMCRMIQTKVQLWESITEKEGNTKKSSGID